MKKEMLINVLQPEECRIAIVEDGVLEELYVERTSQESYVGNIYKGRIVNIEPSIQAAFVDFGIGRNGFLHVSDVEPAYYRHLEQQRGENGGRRGGRRRSQGRPATAPVPEEPEFEELSWESQSGFSVAPAAATGSQLETPERESRSGQRRSKESSRSRGRSRRRPPERKPESPAEPAEPEIVADVSTDVPETASQASPEPASGEPDSALPEEPTRYMNSAERRTEEADLPDPEPESSSTLSDEDIFFPRAAPDTGPSTAKATETPPVEQAARPPEPAQSVFAPAPDEEWDLRVNRRSTMPARKARRYPEKSCRSTRRLRCPMRILPSCPAKTDRQGGANASREILMRKSMDTGAADRRATSRRGRPFRRLSGRPGMGRPKPLIQDIFKRGQEVLVQVIKEGIGTKGPTLSTYISIAGRYLVLMPGLNRIGVSRKIADDEAAAPAARDFSRAATAQGPGLHHPHRRHRQNEERAATRSRLSVTALASGRSPHPQIKGAGGDLSRKRHDHPDNPRHLHQRYRYHLGR